MVQNFKKTAFAVMALTLLLAGCTTTKEVVQITEQEVVDNTALVAGLPAVAPDTTALKYLAGNATLNLNVNGSNISLKGKLRIKRGEGVQISITPLGLVEAACIEFLPQKINFINKLTKKYTEVPYSEASAIGLGGINYRVIEAIFLNYAFLPDGRPAGKALREFDIKDNADGYRLATKGSSAMQYSFLIDKNSGNLVTLSGNSSTGESIKCDYSKFSRLGNVSFPNDICINFKGDATIKLDFGLSKTSNKTFSFSSRSTSSYRKQSIGDFIKSIK